MTDSGLTCFLRAGLAPVLALALAALAPLAGASEAPGQGFPLRGGALSAPLAASASAPVAALAPVVRPADPAPPAGDFESQPFGFPENTRRHQRAAQQKESSVLPSIFPILFYVLLICGAFIALLCFARRYLPGHRQLFSHPAMEVLGRTHLDQRRYVSLIRVGKRILVVGVSPDEIAPLSEITDDGEITGIMEVARPKTEMGLSIFQRLFQQQITETEKAETRAMATEKARELEERTASLRKQVDAIRNQGETPEPRRRLDALG